MLQDNLNLYRCVCRFHHVYNTVSHAYAHDWLYISFIRCNRTTIIAIISQTSKILTICNMQVSMCYK